MKPDKAECTGELGSLVMTESGGYTRRVQREEKAKKMHTYRVVATANRLVDLVATIEAVNENEAQDKAEMLSWGDFEEMPANPMPANPMPDITIESVELDD